MACKIEKAPNGKINKVLDESGNKSLLFQQILNTPVLSLDEVIDTYKNSYSDKLKSKVKYQILGEKGTRNSDLVEQNLETPPQITQEIINRLKQTGLAEDVFLLSTEEIDAKLKEIGQENVKNTTTGFVYKNQVYINTDLANDSVLLHEFSHLFNNWAKTARPEIYSKGLNLVKAELQKDNSEIVNIISYVRTTQPNLKGEAFQEEILTEFISRRSAELMDEQKAKSPLMQWLYDLWTELKNILGLTQMTAEQVANMSLRDYADAMVSDLMRGEVIKGQQAQEYFTREADRLPLTLAVFDTKPFKDLQGKQANPVTIQQLLNKTGIKQIEKDLINQILSDNYSGQKRINYDEFEATVRANIMPLERLTTSSYADYGMDNLGDGNYGEAKTLILNSPIEHGVTGHFSGDFEASTRQNIKYEAKQLNDNTWVAVEEGYESQANDNNIYQFVGTAGTKEAVDLWIIKYDLSQGKIFDNKKYLVYQDAYDQVDNVLPLAGFDTEQEAKDFIEQNRNNYSYNLDYVDEQYLKNIWNLEQTNKGMFGHIRVWQDGQDFYVAELQSDYFQKNNAKSIVNQNEELKSLLREKTQISTTEDVQLAQERHYPEYAVDRVQVVSINELPKWAKENNIDEERLSRMQQRANATADKPYLLFDVEYDRFQPFDFYATKKEAQENKNKIDEKRAELNKPLKHIPLSKKQEYADVIENTRKTIRKELESEINKKISVAQEKALKNATPQEKQFIASQKIWEQRMVREAIKEASLSGATSLRLPTPYTLSVIEGYVSEDGNRLPYTTTRNIDEDKLVNGDTIEHAGDDYVVVESDNLSITVMDLRSTNEELSFQEFIDKYGFEPTEGKLSDELKGTEEIYFYDQRFGIIYTWWNDSPSLSFSQPYVYREQGVNGKEGFSIEDDLSDTQQTVARKYEEIAEILRKERGDNFEVVTDENGFDWYETKIESSEVNNPVVAFQIIGEQGASRTEDFSRGSQQKVIEPNLSFETPSGEVFSNYKDALKATNEGRIKLKIDDVTIAEVDSDTNIDTFNGTINHLVKQGGLTGERILDANGDIIYVAEGQSETAKHFTAELVEKQALKLLGQSGVTLTKSGDFILEDTLNKVTILGTEYDRKEIDELTYEQLTNKFNKEIALEIEAGREFVKALQPTQTKKRLDDALIVKTEDELVSSIKSLLNNLGIKVTSIDDYIKHNTLKNDGVAPESSALMDLVNKIMAFRDGTITREDLIEETMHLIEASIDPTLTAGIRNSIHKTEEWKQYSQQYFDIYSKEYSGDKLDEMVRREILGKVMANGVINNFQLEEGATLTQQSIFSRIMEMLQDFFNTINNFFKPEYLQKIEALNNDIYAKLMAGTLANDINLSQDYGTKFRLYSVSNNAINDDIVRMQKQAERALDVLRNNISQLGKEDPSQNQLLKTANDLINKVQEKVKNDNEVEARLELIATFSKVVNMVQKQTRYLERALKKASQNKYPFSSEEMIVYNNLINEFYKNILPAVEKPLKALDNKTNEEKRLLEAVIKANNNIASLIGDVQNSGFKADEYVINMLTQRLGLDAETQEFLRKKVTGLQDETNWFFMQFGNLSHSSNIFLNSLGHIITKTDFDKRQGFQRDIKSSIDELSKTGYLNKGLSDLARGNYIQSVYDFDRIDEAVNQKRYELYYKFLQKDLDNVKSAEDKKAIENKLANKLTLEEFSKIDGIDDLSSDSSIEFRKEFELWQLEEMRLSPLNLETTKERRQRLDKYHKVTQDFEQSARLTYSSILQNSELVDGKPLFTEDMRYDLEDLRKLRVENKNIYDRDGNLKKGLTIVPSDTIGARKIDDRTYVLLDSDANTEAILAVELNEIDNERMEENRKRFESSPVGLSDDFKEMLSKMNGKEAYDFLMLNSYVGYTNDYYDNIKRETVIDKLEGAKTDENSEDIDTLISKITSTQQKINNILKANRMMNHPSETNFDRMDSLETTSIKDYSVMLENYYSEARRYLGKQEQEEVENALSETVVNKAFVDYVYDTQRVSRLNYSDKTVLDKTDKENINKIFSVIEGHVTESKKVQILEFREDIKRFSKGKINKLGLAHKRVFKLSEEEYLQMTEEETFAYMTNELLQYSYSRLLPYFKKNQPIGADIALNQLEAGAISASEFIDNYENGSYPYLQITPNYNFQEVSEDNNKSKHFQNHVNNSTPFFRIFEDNVTLEDVQTKSIDNINFNKYVNKDFLKEYDIDLVELYTTGKETARKNTDKFKARQILLDLQKETLRKYDVLGKHNLYQLPQKEKSKTRKFDEFLKSGKGIKSVFEEMVNFREDEAELGQDAGKAKTIKTDGSYSIPKYGLRKLKDSPVTDDLLESYTWMNYKANEYNARKVNIGDALALNQALMGAEFEGNIDLKTSRVYKMFKESMDYNFYGVKEVWSKQFNLFGTQFDLAKILNNFGQMIRFRNLGFTLISPITSATTGSVFLRIESLVGEIVDKDAIKTANRFFMKYAGDASREILSLQSKSMLNSLGELYGWYDPMERYENTAYGKAIRGLGKSPFAAHQLANFPVNTRVGLAVLANSKFVNGEMLEYRQYKQQNKGKSDKELRAEWENYTSVLDTVKIDDNGTISYDYDMISTALGNNMTTEQAKDFIDSKNTLIKGRIKSAIQNVDGQISTEDKSMSTRNAFFSFMNIHRSWLMIAAQKKLKGRQINTSTGYFEEGSWRSVFRVMGDVVKDARRSGVINTLANIRKRYSEYDEVTKRNIIRTLWEWGILNTLVGLTLLAMGELDDDDEDSLLFKQGSLFLFRTTNEVASSTVALPKNIYDTLENVIVGLNTIEIATDFFDIFSSDVIERGRYKGLTESERYFYRHAPLMRDYNNLWRDTEGAIKSYNYFNFNKGKTLDYLTIYPFFLEEKK